jgi:hypothetical protein
MGDRTNEIERHIEEKRYELSENVSELRNKVKNAVDWRAQFEQRPLAMIGLAFGGGVLLSAVLPSVSRSNGKKYSNGYLERISDSGTERRNELLNGSQKSEVLSKAAQTFSGIKGALLAVGASKLTGYLEELVPGFGEHYKKWEMQNPQGNKWETQPGM